MKALIVALVLSLCSCEALQGLEKTVSPNIEVWAEDGDAPLIVWRYRVEAPSVGDWVSFKVDGSDAFYRVVSKTYAVGRTIVQVAAD